MTDDDRALWYLFSYHDHCGDDRSACCWNRNGDENFLSSANSLSHDWNENYLNCSDPSPWSSDWNSVCFESVQQSFVICFLESLFFHTNHQCWGFLHLLWFVMLQQLESMLWNPMHRRQQSYQLHFRLFQDSTRLTDYLTSLTKKQQPPVVRLKTSNPSRRMAFCYFSLLVANEWFYMNKINS